MSKLAEIAKLLDLREDADHVTILAAVAALNDDNDADDSQPAGDVSEQRFTELDGSTTDQRFSYYKGDDVVEREDAQTGEQAVFHANGPGYWTELNRVDFHRVAITAAEAQQRLGPDAELEAEIFQPSARSSRWRRWAAVLGLAR
jgi:hypothetical protein